MSGRTSPAIPGARWPGTGPRSTGWGPLPRCTTIMKVFFESEFSKLLHWWHIFNFQWYWWVLPQIFTKSDIANSKRNTYLLESSVPPQLFFLFLGRWIDFQTNSQNVSTHYNCYYDYYYLMPFIYIGPRGIVESIVLFEAGVLQCSALHFHLLQ